MAKADISRLCELGDPPCAAWIAEQLAQHLRGFRLKQRLELTPLDRGLARHAAFDEHAVENNSCVAFDVKKTDPLLPA